MHKQQRVRTAARNKLHVLSSHDSPRPVASPAGHLADAEFGDEAERGALRDLQLGRDQSGRHHRPRQDEFDQSRQA